MKKFFIYLAAALLTLSVNAQSFAPQTLKGITESQKIYVSSQVKKAPTKAALASNQRIAGYSTNDDCDKCIGIGRYYTGDTKVGILLTPEDFVDYIGAKVVGVRFYLAQSTASSIFVNDGQTGQEKSSQTCDAKTIGWNTVMFDEDKQFTIGSSDYYLLGYTYKQTLSNYPIGINTNATPGTMYIYANIPTSSGGQGLGWYNMGSSYSPCIQLLIESDNFSANSVMISSSFSPLRILKDGKRSQTFVLYNHGASLKDIDYSIKYGDTEVVNKHTALKNALGVCGETTISVDFPAAAEAGKTDASFTITKVNGEDNTSVNKTSAATQITIPEKLNKVSVIEEATGAECGWCPRGHVGMEKVRNTFGDKAIGIAVHIYSSGDAMYNSNFSNYAGVLPSANAPVCVVGRHTDLIDPYYGTGESIVDDITYDQGIPTELTVSVNGEWNENKKSVLAKATVNTIIAGKYDIAYALVADGLTGTTNTWKQSNYYSSEYASSTGFSQSDYPSDLKFLWSQSKKMIQTYNDVMIASSYKTKNNQATTLGEIAANQPIENTYTLTMPTNTTLLKAIDYSKVSVVALVLDENGYIVNAAKSAIVDPTGISTVGINGKAANEVARYTVDGRQVSAPVKGLNIVKMSDGTTMKVMVK